MNGDVVVTGSEGSTVRIYGDLDKDDRPIAIMHLSCPMDGRDEIDVPGVRGLRIDCEFTVDANGAFTADEVELIVAGLRHATRAVES